MSLISKQAKIDEICDVGMRSGLSRTAQSEPIRDMAAKK
jgi:hypothetical protein